MDSQKAGNYANVGMFFIAILALIVSLATLGYMYWVRMYPDPEKVPPMTDTGALITGWVPVIIVSASSLFSALILLLATARRWKNKTLKSKVSDLEKDLELEKAKVEAEKGNVTDAFREIEKLKDALVEADRKSKADLLEADKRTNEQRGMKEDILTELRKRQEDLAELKTLSDMRLTQAENIKDHVIITRVNAGDLVLDGNQETGPCLTLELRIKNESLYNISIRPNEIAGSLAFADQPLKEPVFAINDAWREPIENLRPFASEGITLQQPLRGFEVERIKSLPDGRFRLTPLRVPITVHSQYHVPLKNLRITPEIDNLPINAFRVTKSLDSKD